MAKITIGGNETNTIGELPAVGSMAPDFELASSGLEPVRLADFKGKKLILNVVPSVDTGVCSLSAKTFEKRAGEAENTVVLLVSVDLPMRYASFSADEAISHVQMASGFKSSFGEDYGLTLTDGKFEALYSRAIVVIDETGKIIYTEQVPEIGQEPNYDAALNAVK